MVSYLQSSDIVGMVGNALPIVGMVGIRVGHAIAMVSYICG